MANVVTCKLTINGNVDDVKKAVEINGSLFDFNGIVQMPKDGEIVNGKPFIENDMLDAGECEDESNWYGWGLKHWGTPSNAHQDTIEIIEEDDDHIIYLFLTDDNAPFALAEAVSKKFGADVTLEFYDENIGYDCGRYRYENGEPTETTYFDCPNDESLDFLEKMGCYELEEAYARDENGGWYNIIQDEFEDDDEYDDEDDEE